MMKLQIITPDVKVFEGEVKVVTVPGSKGSFQILWNHAPIISTLVSGKVSIIDMNDRSASFPVSGGVIEVKNNVIVILADSA